MAFASEEIIGFFNKVKYPYNINILTQRLVSEEIDQEDRKKEWVEMLLKQRAMLAEMLNQLPIVEKVYKSDANFLLTKVTDANGIYNYLVGKGIIVRNRNTVQLCGNCLRITVGTKEENETLIDALKAY
jgi:histidinol-phosphate aminotransferase